MLINLAQPAAPKALDVDLCIIGGGPAGICIASEFLESGQSVAILEGGFLDINTPTQLLNLGLARGTIAQQDPFYLSTSRLRVLGGSQLAWGGWCTPMTEIDFKHRDWVPHSGWPISLEQLIPYYERTARMFALHQSTARPNEERPILGGETTERLYYFAPGRRTARDIFETKLADAQNVFLCIGANADNIRCDAGGTRVREIHARSLDGAELSVTAKNVILAAGGIENARLLLNNGLGNQHDLVGRFFMEHPHVLIGSALLPDKNKWLRYLEQMDPELGHSAMFALALPEEVQRKYELLNGTVQIWPYDGTPQEADDQDVLHAALVLRTEQRPNRNSRVMLGTDRDPLGTRVAHLDWEVAPDDWGSVCATARLVGSALERYAGARVELTVSEDSPWPAFPLNSEHYNPWGCHHMGTTRMSNDADCGVVDADTRVHGMENLFIAGSSIFPTGGYANPTFTLVALALRTADYVRHIM